MPYRNKKKYRLKPIPILTLILIGLLIWFCVLLFSRLSPAKEAPLVQSSSEPVSAPESRASSSDEITDNIGVIPNGKITNTYDKLTPITPIKDDPLWNLILINQSYFLTDEIPFESATPTPSLDSQAIDSRIAAEYEAMAAAAKAEGITLYLRSGYRSINKQKTFYESNVAAYKKQGNSEEKAIEMTRAYYTVPGHSEHHSGLAADIITTEYQQTIQTLDERFAGTDAYAWLIKNCAEYGFILRYPKDKVEVTTIQFEPWHYRYVGKIHAQAIMKSGVCLEEYIESMNLSYEEYKKLNPNSPKTLAEFAKEFAEVYSK